MEKPRIIVVGAAWYGDWAKSFYQAFERLGYQTEIVYNNSLPAPIGGNKDGVTSWFEKAKLTMKKNPRLFAFLKNIRQRLSEREILVRLGRADLNRDEAVIIFVWTPGSTWVLEKLRSKKNIKLVLWLGEPVVRDASWEPKFDYFDRIFMVDEGVWKDALSEKNKERVQLLPLSSDDSIFHPLADVPAAYRSDVAFVGKYLPSRAKSLEPLKDYDLKIYGYGWETGFDDFPWLKNAYKGSIATEDLNYVYNGTKIAIGTLGMPKDPYTTATMRTFDIGLTGTFQVSEEIALSKKLFGDSIGFYKDNADLAHLVSYYLSHDKERKEKGDRSRHIAERWSYSEDAKRVLRACGYEA